MRDRDRANYEMYEDDEPPLAVMILTVIVMAPFLALLTALAWAKSTVAP